jgi:hypothetical protein
MRVTYQECVFNGTLPSNRCPPIVESVTSRMCLPSRCLAMVKRHNNILIFHAETLVFPSALKNIGKLFNTVIWLRHYATSRQVAGLFPDEVI